MSGIEIDTAGAVIEEEYQGIPGQDSINAQGNENGQAGRSNGQARTDDLRLDQLPPLPDGDPYLQCDHRIWEVLWRWASRRHPNKGKRWIKQRYFICMKGRDWRFTTKDKILPLLSGFTKRTHIKINAEANPYDPKYDEYFSIAAWP